MFLNNQLYLLKSQNHHLLTVFVNNINQATYQKRTSATIIMIRAVRTAEILLQMFRFTRMFIYVLKIMYVRLLLESDTLWMNKVERTETSLHSQLSCCETTRQQTADIASEFTINSFPAQEATPAALNKDDVVTTQLVMSRVWTSQLIQPSKENAESHLIDLQAYKFSFDVVSSQNYSLQSDMQQAAELELIRSKSNKLRLGFSLLHVSLRPNLSLYELNVYNENIFSCSLCDLGNNSVLNNTSCPPIGRIIRSSKRTK